MQVRRRHHELDVRRRLLNRLEQRVERVLRQPVHFVDDENLEAVAHRRHRERLDDDFAHRVHARVGRAVDLEHVDVAASAISLQASHSPHGVAVGPLTQLSARARMRAVVVLPTPRGPAKMKDCASRPVAIAFSSVRTTPRCPMTSSNRCGRHLRANARWDMGRIDSNAPEPRPGGPAAQHRIDLALLPSGPDAVRRLNLHRVRTAVRGAVLRSLACAIASPGAVP